MTHLSLFSFSHSILHGYGRLLEDFVDILFLILCYVIEPGFNAGLYMYMHMHM